jgi:8-oxo-dGTP diphosphatase
VGSDESRQAHPPAAGGGAPEPDGASVRVVAAVIRRGDRLLVCQRPRHKRHGGLWEFPGGKREPGEDDADALRRELREELELTLLRAGTPEFELRDPDSPFLIVFVPVEVAGEPVRHEHAALCWGTVEQIGELPLAPSDRGYVEFLRGAPRS